MNKPNSISIPIIYYDNEPWFLLNYISQKGLVRAAFISKPRHVRDFDGHHCEEVAVKTSIRFKPKKFDSLI